MMKKYTSLALLFLLISSFSIAQVSYPSWTYEMKVWPFDILYPFQTGFATMNGELATSDEDIRDNLDDAISHNANVVIFYLDDEQTYETFVDETGFTQTLSRVQYLVEQAHARNLKAVCYLNGLEVISVGAKDDAQMPSLSRNNSEWLQVDIDDNPMVWFTDGQTEWIPPNSEDAWASPLSPWKDLFNGRIVSLASTGLDGVYIDATFLPGVDSYGIKWASTDSYFAAEFMTQYGLSTPSQIDWDSEEWRKWIYFRHEVIRDYLGGMASTARNSGMVAFFESSSCDYESGTFLANDVAFTISGGIACSPEIEPEGDYKAAFRMSKATKDANQDFPSWFLGWPETDDIASREYAVTLCHSGNYYPTIEAIDSYDATRFDFMDRIRESVLDKRVPQQSTALIYAMRSKDYTFEDESTLESYFSAFSILSSNHVDFRILPLETMSAADLQGISHVVLAGAESMSDAEYNLLKDKTISLLGSNGVNDEWGTRRSESLSFSTTVDINIIRAGLPFTIVAPSTTYIEYYKDDLESGHYFLFAYSDQVTGNIIINSSSPLTGNVYEVSSSTQNISGTTIIVPISDYLEVIEVRTSTTTAVSDNDLSSSQGLGIKNYPNPFSESAVFSVTIPHTEWISLTLYNLQGKVVATIVEERLDQGEYEFAYATDNLPPGTYYAKLRSENQSVNCKIVLLR